MGPKTGPRFFMSIELTPRSLSGVTDCGESAGFTFADRFLFLAHLRPHRHHSYQPIQFNDAPSLLSGVDFWGRKCVKTVKKSLRRNWRCDVFHWLPTSLVSKWIPVSLCYQNNHDTRTIFNTYTVQRKRKKMNSKCWEWNSLSERDKHPVP